MSMRNRSAAKGKASPHSNGGSYDSKNVDKKIPNLTIVIWAAISIAVVFLFASAISDDSYDSHRTLRPKASKHGKGKKSKGKALSLNHKKGFGTGKKTTPCPEEFKKSFWIETKKINQPVSRALRMQGWEKTDNYEEAQVIWTYASTTDWYDKLKPWQRYNHIPGYKLWNQKDTFVTYMLDYAEKSGKELPAVPETYRLDVDVELNKFKKRLFEGGGIDIPWVLKKPNVNQGKGIYMLGPNTKELENVFDTVEADKDSQNYIIQRYICNEMTINNRKFDFRIFWVVASLDPLIMIYHDGYLRIGNSVYNENDFSSTTAHLTTHTGLSAEGKGTWDNFIDYIEEAKKNNKKLKKIKDPVLHVKNQVKQVLGEMAAAFKEGTFNAEKISSENGFGFYGGDFIIDWDLDVFFIEPQHGCGLDEDHQFRVDMHNSLFSGMIDAAEEIWERQERGLPTDNKSLENLGGYEVVYNDGWMFEYDGYSRSKDKKGCAIATTKK
mmetsp:Transcript_4364/g.7314  ORF Transcript_4364/g.7314 Transcript_4364/m.7314 type:complete len:495 (+) Transcript_4364:64-1548(+)